MEGTPGQPAAAWLKSYLFLPSPWAGFAGWFTPTEAGAVGAAGVLLAALAGKDLNMEGFRKSLYDTTRTTAMIMLMIAGAMIFGRFMAISRVPFELAAWTGSLPLPPVAVLALILLIYLILGCFIDALALILLTILFSSGGSGPGLRSYLV